MRAIRRAIVATSLLLTVFVPAAGAETFAGNDPNGDAHPMADIVRFAATYHGTRLDVDVVVQHGRNFGTLEWRDERLAILVGVSFDGDDEADAVALMYWHANEQKVLVDTLTTDGDVCSVREPIYQVDLAKPQPRPGTYSLPVDAGCWGAPPSLRYGVSVAFDDEVDGAPDEVLSPALARALTSRHGYWLLGRDGGVFSYGDAQFYGSTGNLRLNQPVVGMEATPTGRGYWFAAADGGVFSFGDAHFFGSTGDIVLNKPIVGMAATTSGNGYWLVAADGGVFAFGDAEYVGSAGNLTLAQPIVGMVPTPTGRGYWMVAADGGVFSFGDAEFKGSAVGSLFGARAVAMAATATGAGYWIAGAQGAVITFGDARALSRPEGPPVTIVGFARGNEGGWQLTPQGRVIALSGQSIAGRSFGEKWYGDASGLALSAPIVGMTATP